MTVKYRAMMLEAGNLSALAVLMLVVWSIHSQAQTPPSLSCCLLGPNSTETWTPTAQQIADLDANIGSVAKLQPDGTT
jgi:hypothetical protein